MKTTKLLACYKVDSVWSLLFINFVTRRCLWSVALLYKHDLLLTIWKYKTERNCVGHGIQLCSENNCVMLCGQLRRKPALKEAGSVELRQTAACVTLV